MRARGIISDFCGDSSKEKRFDNHSSPVEFLKKKIGENILVDIGGFFYGFVVQGGAIFVILLWKILLDIIFLPRDILKELQK